MKITNLTPILFLFALLLASCGQKPEQPAPVGVVDSQVQTNGTFEVTAKLLEIPEGAIFKRELYDYATILKYQVLKVHRGEIKSSNILVGQYNPFKPRSQAADARVKLIGGNHREFRAGQVHHMALEFPIEDHFMGGIVNKYFDPTNSDSQKIYWAVWTDLEK